MTLPRRRAELERSPASAADDTIALVEEKLTVGKRAVAGGSVRVRSYVVETPVQEQVSLGAEKISIERRAVDRTLTCADDAAFLDRTIEATETDEEAVVAKTARVAGEVVVRKGVEERVETVRDTVRRTEVEVDDDRTAFRGAAEPVVPVPASADKAAAPSKPMNPESRRKPLEAGAGTGRRSRPVPASSFGAESARFAAPVPLFAGRLAGDGGLPVAPNQRVRRP